MTADRGGCLERRVDGHRAHGVLRCPGGVGDAGSVVRYTVHAGPMVANDARRSGLWTRPGQIERQGAEPVGKATHRHGRKL